ncbi:MAG: KUP/HAK/KT family potassium transporter [Chloroflexota bacterium]
MVNREPLSKGIIRSLGLVFGDIGTSPIYTITVVFLLARPTRDNILGVLSLIVWTLVILVTVQYTWMAMGLGRKGEGGTIVLRELLAPLLRRGKEVAFVSMLSFIGVSLLVGDGIITPAISILSAVEGALLIPGLEKTPQDVLILTAGIIAIALFSVQRKGTEKVAGAFGPIMIVWFMSLALSGMVSIVGVPNIVQALNPYHAIRFFTDNGLAAFFILSEVFLCATGGEALYADMGHLGRRPIVNAWYVVFFALVINYYGQGAFLMQHPEAKNVLFSMVQSQAPALYIPFLILSIVATIIASQAMISGMFSIFYQAIMTHIMPFLKISYTSTETRSQIYIGVVNWSLLFAVLFVMVQFRESSRLAAAYGLAVTGTMTLTCIMMAWIFWLRDKKTLACLAAALIPIDAVYLLSNMYKIPHGGYWSIVLAIIPFGFIMLYTRGQRRLYKALRPMPIEAFLERYTHAYRHSKRINGTALFFARDVRWITPYIVRTMLNQGIIYEDNIFVSMVRRDDPFGATGFFKETIAPGLRTFEIQFGYMEVFDVEEIIREAGIDERAIFYGIEDISTCKLMWRIFAAIKKLTPTFVQFFKLPSQKLHGIITRVEM